MLRDHLGWSAAPICLGRGAFGAKTGQSWANWGGQSPWDRRCLAIMSLDGALVHWGLGLGRGMCTSSWTLALASGSVCCGVL